MLILLLDGLAFCFVLLAFQRPVGFICSLHSSLGVPRLPGAWLLVSSVLRVAGSGQWLPCRDLLRGSSLLPSADVLSNYFGGSSWIKCDDDKVDDKVIVK